MSNWNLTHLIVVSTLLSGCGGGDGNASSAANVALAATGTERSAALASPARPPVTPPPRSGTAPGGLYVGYYMEDPLTNPEDPVPGAFILNLPASDGAFSGSMFFTYVGCQSSNVGAISGTKAAAALSGRWSGTVDGQLESGGYTGSYAASTLSYSGTYTHDGGKTFRDLAPCTQYYIAADGTWEMFAVNTSIPAGFGVTVAGRTVSWTAPPAGGAFELVYVIDPEIAQTSGNPVLWQAVVTSGSSVAVPDTIALMSGKAYVASVAALNASYQRVAFGSVSFTRP